MCIVWRINAILKTIGPKNRSQIQGTDSEGIGTPASAGGKSGLIGEILHLIAAGKNNQQIAKSLFLSLKTVRNYVSNIFTKLQVADRAQAIVRAREAGLGQEGQ